MVPEHLQCWGNSIGQKPIHPALLGFHTIKQDGRFIECGVDHNKNAHCGKSQAAFLILQKIILVEIVVFLKISLMIEIPIIIYPELDGHLYLLDYSLVLRQWLLHH